jgi:hypothetical protein
VLAGTQFRCESDKRRDAVIASSTINGIDYLEVVDSSAKSSPDSPRQRTLLVHLFKVPGTTLDASNVMITGGVRVPVGVEWAYLRGAFPDTLQSEQAMIEALPDGDRVLMVRTTSSGDYSTYQLALVRSAVDPRPPTSFDPKLSTVDLFFKVECPSDLDCATADPCPPATAVEPEIDYLAKDWSSFRRLMLERMSSIMPGWRERHPADVGMVAVEVIAYAADHLSYFQDAVATEAYLGTARKRVSVRRHARLLDYPISDGSNARAWVAITWRGAGGVTLPRASRLFTRVPGLPAVVRTPDALARAVAAGAAWFETVEPLALDAGLNQIQLYTWGDDRCCLPRGATRATLDNTGNRLAGLEPGAVIVLGEVLSPETALPEDADPSHRQAVRLKTVDLTATDPLFTEPDGVTPQRVAEVTWDDDDALTAPLCLWRIEPIEADHKGRVTLNKPAVVPIVVRIAAIDGASQATSLRWSSDGGLTFVAGSPTAGAYTDSATGITATFTPPFEIGETFAFGPAGVAWGNVVLADHGMTRAEEVLPIVTGGATYRPRLGAGPVTQIAPYDGAAPASHALRWDPRDVRASVALEFPQEIGVIWRPDRDLLESSPFEHAFVVETEDDGSTFLRFGDGTLGRRPDATPLGGDGTPDPAMRPRATYRVGNGAVGNVGADAIGHAAFDPAIGTAFDQIALVSNPVAASGGRDPETIDEVKLYAPQAFRTQKRAVTTDDYARVAERHPQVAKAAATRRWTGSWYTIFLSIDRRGGGPIDDEFEAELRAFLEPFRLAAQDIEIERPVFVPLEIVLAVCVEDRYYRADVRRALLAAFGSRDLPDGTRGFFHPDNFTFGQPVYLSRVIATAMAVPGVRWVDPSPGETVFRRLADRPSNVDLINGKADMARLEIARLDNDPSFPENGTIDFALEGGS